ncbi:MAG: DNA repair protein RecN [Betaproteobacteria bacterium]|jgi:DNA repair protein RecN (Recombination protein N)|nr:DNA repair protein RecN [Betaproteobacteria bacterium]
MLQRLDIRDFVIVHQLELEMGPGFTVLTGETGAGKSILLDALSLTMGERADVSQIREGCDRSEICATFYIASAILSPITLWLTEAGFPIEEDGKSLQLKRIIETHGRTKAYINGSSATLTQMREIAEQLVDIHGQHQHQLLLKPGAQRDLLDRHAQLSELTLLVSKSYQHWHSIEKKLLRAKEAGTQLLQEQERLRWQLEELQTLKPLPGEWDEIQKEHSRLANAAALIDGTQALINLLSDGDQALLDQLAKAQNILDDLVDMDTSLQDAKEALEPAAIQISDAVHSINRYLQKLDLDPDRLAEVEERLQSYYRLSKKFHCSAQDLPTIWQDLQEKLLVLEASQNISALEQESQIAQELFNKYAQDLSKKRQKAAQELAHSVTAAMQDLAMSGGQFEVALTPSAGNAFGLEQVEFLVAGHPGVQPKAIAKVASGGELARISLAIAVIASSASSVPTLIFDEVDAGIGGVVAQTVGGLLKKLGQTRQVLCVTHLPQVASQGDNQWRVKKVSTEHQTHSEIEVLSRPERVEEIARMLGGAAITPTTRRHARELLG